MPTTEAPAAHDLPFTRELRAALMAECEGAGATLFALIDGARVPKLWVILRELRVEHAPLFRESPKENIIHVAPFLTRMDPGDVAPLWLSVQEAALEAAVFVVARASLRELRRHFRRFLLVLDAAGTMAVYLRYYDPRVLEPFLATSTEIERRRFFGEVRRFFVWDREQTTATRKIAFRSWLRADNCDQPLPPPPGVHRPFQLRPEHEAAFARAAMESYDRRAAAYLREKYPNRLREATDQDVLAIVNRAKQLAPELGLASGRDATRTAELLVLGFTEDAQRHLLSLPLNERSEELLRLRGQLAHGSQK